ncbi:tape measure protein [Sphingobacterium anhuiense]|uniref:tape measure protein n=1 Tax=Sphingobacterium anhuiense TaxID=493780 RepID=UPI003C2BD244
MAEVNRLEWDAYIRDSELMQSLNRIERRIIQTADTATRRGGDLEGMFKKAAQAATTFLSLNAAQGFVQKLIQIRSEFQQLDIAFTTMLKSKERADQLTKDLVEFAATTPFGMKETANAAKQLLAYGSSAESVKDELRMLGDVAAGTSQPIGDLVYLYGTLRTQGRAYLMDIRQFAGRGIPIYQELAKVLNVSKSQVNDLASAGKIGFAEVQKAFQNMTASGSMFGGLMEAQSHTIQGQLERLGDGIDQMFNKLGEKSEGTIALIIDGASSVVENYETVLEIVSALIVTYGAYRAALVLTVAMQNITAASAVGMTAAEMLHYGAIVAKTSAMRILNAVMLASPVVAFTALISASAAVIYSFTQVTDAATLSQSKLNEAHEAGAKKADSEKRSIEQLITVIKSHTASVEQKKAAYDKLQSQTGGILLSFSQEEIAVGKAKDSLDDYIKKIREAVSARKAFDEFNEMAGQLDELNRKGADGVGIWTKLGRSIKNTFIPTSQGVGFKEWGQALFSSGKMGELIVNQEKEALNKSMDVLKKQYNDRWQKIITGVPEDGVKKAVDRLAEPLKNFSSILSSAKSKADLDGLKKALTEEMEKLAPGDKEIAKYKSKLEQLAAIEKQYSIGGKGNSSAENSAYQQAERYNSLKLDIDKANESYLRSQLSRDQQEVESVRDKYRALREEIRKFNADPRNKTKIDGSSINATESNEIKETNVKIDTKYIVDNLNQQKALYDQFEAYKLQVGEEKAKERFQNELDVTKTYGQLIEEEMYKLLETDPTQMTSSQRERLEVLTKMQIDFYQQDKAREIAKYAESLQLSQTSKDKLLAIDKKYQDAYEQLEKNKTSLTVEEYEKRKEALKKGRLQESGDILLPDLQKANDWINVFDKSSLLAVSKVRQSVSTLKTSLEQMLSDGRITVEQYNDALKQIKGVEVEVSVSEKGFGRLKQVIKELKEAEKGSLKYDQARQKLAQEINYWGQGLVEAGNEALNVADQLGLGSEKFKEDMALSLNLAGDAVNLASSIASGDVVGIVVNGIKTLSSAISLFTKDRGIERKIQDYQRQIEALGKSYEAIQRKMNGNDTNYYGNSDQLIANLKEQQRLLEQSAKAEEDKKKTDKEKVKGYKEQSEAINKQIEDTENAVRQMRLQTDINSLAQSITDALAGAWESGEDGIEAMDKAFDKFIKNSVANSARLKFVQKIIDDMLKDVDKYMAKNDNSIVGFDFSEWDKKLNQAGKDAMDFLESAYKGLGLKKEGESGGGLSGTIKQNITEAQANVLEGLGRNSVDLSKRKLLEMQSHGLTLSKQLDIANQKLTVLNQISTNTANTVARLDTAIGELQKVNKSLGGKY